LDRYFPLSEETLTRTAGESALELQQQALEAITKVLTAGVIQKKVDRKIAVEDNHAEFLNRNEPVRRNEIFIDHTHDVAVHAYDVKRQVQQQECTGYHHQHVGRAQPSVTAEGRGLLAVAPDSEVRDGPSGGVARVLAESTLLQSEARLADTKLENLVHYFYIQQ
jgi:hypothetical protein